MNRLITYLTFNGNCKEAMEFYQSCLGGELRLQTLGDSPRTANLPERMSAYIVEASLKCDNLVLMGTDLTDEELLRGNSVSILLDCNDENRIKTYFQNLKAGGKAIYPLQPSYWGYLSGSLTDKYGNNWLFHCHREM